MKRNIISIFVLVTLWACGNRESNDKVVDRQVTACPIFSLSQGDSTFVLGYKIIRRAGGRADEYVYFNRIGEDGKLIQQKIKIDKGLFSENSIRLLYSDTARFEKIAKGLEKEFRVYVPANTRFKKVIELGGKIIISDQEEPEEFAPESHTTIIPVFHRYR